ncbi:hypothetical protein [Bacillus sp. 3255]|uniref:hypothetical protein n=1 Tax=Bacillus sp. 3255 TaxID=2817904 RepID=UPI0028583493|nr:hypothetical protein [Bacillus sp. 3255]MDR6882598.1 putative cell wall-binding protein [Bacillus sp. 3255]
MNKTMRWEARIPQLGAADVVIIGGSLAMEEDSESILREVKVHSNVLSFLHR